MGPIKRHSLWEAPYGKGAHEGAGYYLKTRQQLRLTDLMEQRREAHETYQGVCTGGDSWRLTIKVAGDRQSACGF